MLDNCCSYKKCSCSIQFGSYILLTACIPVYVGCDLDVIHIACLFMETVSIVGRNL